MAELATQIEDRGNRWQLGLYSGNACVSGLGIVKKRIRVGGVSLRMGGIAGLWTHSDHRLRGFASRAMCDGIDFMRAKGYPLSVLFGIGDFYHRYGFSVVFASSGMDIASSDLRRARGPYAARPMHRADVPAAVRLYSRYNADRTGSAVRGRSWAPTWRMPRMGEGTLRRQGRGLVVVSASGRVVGYAAFDAQAGCLHVSEVAGRNQGAYASLAAAIGRRARRAGAENVRFHLPRGDPFGDFCAQFGSQRFAAYPRNSGSMGRIVDLDRLLLQLCPLFAHRLASAGCSLSRPLTLHTDIGSCTLVPVRGARIDLGSSGGRAWTVEIPQMVLTQLVFGYRAVRDVSLDSGVRIPRSARGLLDVLLPCSHPYMWWADRF